MQTSVYTHTEYSKFVGCESHCLSALSLQDDSYGSQENPTQNNVGLNKKIVQYLEYDCYENQKTQILSRRYSRR